MREIKFRAWDKADKKYYRECDWLCWKPGGIQFCWTDYEKDETMVTQLTKGTYVLLQYTGLHDKNNKEIYEGDIIKTESDTSVLIGWNDIYASFCLTKKGWASAHYFGEAADPDGCEVIGNIYENEGLLK